MSSQARRRSARPGPPAASPSRQVGPDRPADAASTSLGSVTAASGTNTMPASKRSRSRSPTATASRVLPIPPGPVSVTSRTPGGLTRPATSPMACSRPTSDVVPTGSGPRAARDARRCRGTGPDGGGEPLAQQHRQVVAHQPAQLAGRAEGAVGGLPASIRASRSASRGSRSGAGALTYSSRGSPADSSNSSSRPDDLHARGRPARSAASTAR